jgi:2-methylaconitate cis-trans-isomerase PrpF
VGNGNSTGDTQNSTSLNLHLRYLKFHQYLKYFRKAGASAIAVLEKTSTNPTSQLIRKMSPKTDFRILQTHSQAPYRRMGLH